MGFYSFETCLRQVLMSFKQPDPKILEWGPGYSTQIMLQEKKRCEIWTYENDEHWFKVYKERYGALSNVHMYHLPLGGEYENHPKKLGIVFDIVMVDGRNRVDCMHTAYEVMAVDGIMILHDASRKEYLPGMALFRTIIMNDDTAVMVKKDE